MINRQICSIPIPRLLTMLNGLFPCCLLRFDNVFECKADQSTQRLFANEKELNHLISVDSSASEYILVTNNAPLSIFVTHKKIKSVESRVRPLALSLSVSPITHSARVRERRQSKSKHEYVQLDQPLMD